MQEKQDVAAGPGCSVVHLRRTAGGGVEHDIGRRGPGNRVVLAATVDDDDLVRPLGAHVAEGVRQAVLLVESRYDDGNAHDSTPGRGSAAMSEVWYQDGLRFRCTQCGNCCTGAPGFVWVNEDEVAAIAAFREESIEETTALHTRAEGRGRSLRERANGDCVFLDGERRCTIYPVRPRQCRTWPFWESNLATSADWERTCKTCPGSGQGELIPVEEITRRMKVIRL
jgi:uncharacterized protein